MRIAIVNFNADLAGGTETYLHALLPALAARGHQLALAHERTPSGQAGPLDPEGCLETMWDGAALGKAALVEAVAAWSPDVVYVNLILDPGLESELLARFQCAIYHHTYHGTCVSGTKMHAFPTAAFDVGGISDWLEAGVSGELAPGDPPTVEGLADAIVRALSPRDHHQELREGAWRRAVAFSAGTHAATLETVLADCGNRREEQIR